MRNDYWVRLKVRDEKFFRMTALFCKPEQKKKNNKKTGMKGSQIKASTMPDVLFRFESRFKSYGFSSFEIEMESELSAVVTFSGEDVQPARKLFGVRDVRDIEILHDNDGEAYESF